MFNHVLFHCIVLHCMASYPPPTSPVWPNRSKASPASLPPQFRGVPEVLMRPRAALSLEGSSMLTTTLTNHEPHTSPPPAHGSGRCETAPGEFPRRRRPWMELGIDISGYHGDVWRLNLLCFLSHIIKKIWCTRRRDCQLHSSGFTHHCLGTRTCQSVKVNIIHYLVFRFCFCIWVDSPTLCVCVGVGVWVGVCLGVGGACGDVG